MAIEATRLATFEAVVSRLAVCVVGDDAVVAILLNLVCNNYGARVGHALARLLHCGICMSLHSVHASLGPVLERNLTVVHHGGRGRLSLWSLSDRGRLWLTCYRNQSYVSYKLSG